MTKRYRLQHHVADDDIDRAMTDPMLLGAALGDPLSWQGWRAILKAAFGLELNRDEARAFAAVAGSRKPPTQRVRELWAIVGRRGGKSRMAAVIVVYLACFVHHRLSPGERGLVLCLAASIEQARVVFDYARAFLEASPILRQEIDDVTRTEIRLKNNITIAVHANSFRSIRGRTLCGAVFDEVAIWRDELSATPDSEVYTAVLPSLLTTKGMLVGISTGYRRTGLLYQKFRDCFGVDSADTLVVQGSTLQFNTTLTEADINQMMAADPAAAEAEWQGGFRDDLASLFDDAQIDNAVDYARPLELPPDTTGKSWYQAFTDPSGGVGADAYSLAIGHREDSGQFVIDVVRGTKGSYDPYEVTRSYAELCREYHIGAVVGDAYAAQWVAAAWQEHNIGYTKSDLPKSAIYLECIPLFSRGLVRLPDQPTLIRELRLLERRTHRGGKDSVDHPKNGHDDYANACCGVLRQLSSYLGYDTSGKWLGMDERIDQRSYAAQQLYSALMARVNNGGGGVWATRPRQMVWSTPYQSPFRR